MSNKLKRETKRLEAELAEQKDVTRRYYQLLAKEQGALAELQERFDALSRERAIVGEALDAERANAYQEERARARGVEAALAKRSSSRHRILLETAKALGELREEAKNRRHYSNNPRTVLHSWEDHETLDEIGGTCGLCEALARTKPAELCEAFARTKPAEPDPYADRDPNQYYADKEWP